MNIQNLGSKESLGVKFKDRDIRRIVFKPDSFVILSLWDRMVLKPTVQNQSFKESLSKDSLKK